MSQPSKTATFFPDTNFLLECVDPAECPWGELTEADHIRLVIVLKVRSEVDGLKNAGRGRRSDRARAWVSRFRGMRLTGNVAVLREHSPRVEVVPAPILPDMDQPHPLLIGIGDREVLRQIAATCSSRPDLAGPFLTDDGGAYDLAQAAGLDAAEVPLEDGVSKRWRLPPENDTKDKRLVELQKKVEGLEARAPKLMAIVAIEGVAKTSFELKLKRYPPLTEDQVDYAVSLIERHRPKKIDFSTPPPSIGVAGRGVTMWQAPAADKVAKYTEKERPEWDAYCRHFLSSIHLLFEAPNRFVVADLTVSNMGTVPALSMAALIETLGGTSFCTEASEDVPRAEDFTVRILDAPKPPQGRYIDGMLEGLSRTIAWADFSEVPPFPAFHSLIEPRWNEDEVHWRDKPIELGTSAELICGEFRHKHEPDQRQLRLFVGGEAGKLQRCSIRIRFSASNIPEPLLITFPFVLKWEDADTAQATYNLFAGRQLPVGDIPQKALRILNELR